MSSLGFIVLATLLVVGEEEYTNVVTGKARPLRACGVSLSNGLTEGVLASRVVLSTPRAKGVE